MSPEDPRVNLNSPADKWEKLNPAIRILIITSLVTGAGSVGYLYLRLSRIDSTLSGIETQVGPIKTEIGVIDEHVSVLETNVAGIATQIYAAKTQSALNDTSLGAIATEIYEIVGTPTPTP